MDEIKTNELIEEEETTQDPIANYELKSAIETQLSRIRRQSMLLGFQVACHSILEKIVATTGKQGKTSMNDYKRLIKDIEQFCSTGISRKVNTDGETEPIEEEVSTAETVQN